MPLVGTTEMFKKAYQGHYAIGAFNVNNMEIIQGIMEAAKEEESPVILQASEGARNYAGQEYIVGLVKTALQDYPEIPTDSIWTMALLMKSARPALTAVSLPSCMMARSTPSRKMSKSQSRSSNMPMTKASW